MAGDAVLSPYKWNGLRPAFGIIRRASNETIRGFSGKTRFGCMYSGVSHFEEYDSFILSKIANRQQRSYRYVTRVGDLH